MKNTISKRALELYEATRKSTPKLLNSAASSLHLYGEVGVDFTPASVIEALNELEGARAVTVFVNSPGGDYFSGKTIYSALSRFAKSHKVTAVVDGIAASAAALFTMAAPRIEMSPGATMMVHEVSGPAYGRAQDLESMAASMRVENEQLVGIYQRRTGMPMEKVTEMVANETYMTAEQAVELHFADGIHGAPAPMEKPPRTPRNDAGIAKRIVNLRIQMLKSGPASTSPGPAPAATKTAVSPESKS